MRTNPILVGRNEPATGTKIMAKVQPHRASRTNVVVSAENVENGVSPPKKRHHQEAVGGRKAEGIG
jgi:hypothetical protein